MLDSVFKENVFNLYIVFITYIIEIRYFNIHFIL